MATDTVAAGRAGMCFDIVTPALRRALAMDGRQSWPRGDDDYATRADVLDAIAVHFPGVDLDIVRAALDGAAPLATDARPRVRRRSVRRLASDAGHATPNGFFDRFPDARRIRFV